MQVEDALKSIVEFLRNLRFGDDDIDISYGFTQFNQSQIGGMILTGNDRSEYIKCLNGLVTAVEDELVKAIYKNHPKKDNSFSRKGLEGLLQSTLLKAWNAEEGIQQIPEERIKAAIKWLRQELAAPPRTYLVNMAALGVDRSNLPVRIGKLTFFSSESQAATELRDAASMGLTGSHSDASVKQ
jgi:hypothetical protein